MSSSKQSPAALPPAMLSKRCFVEDRYATDAVQSLLGHNAADRYQSIEFWRLLWESFIPKKCEPTSVIGLVCKPELS